MITLDEAITTMKVKSAEERRRGLGSITMSVSDAYRVLCLAVEREQVKAAPLPLYSKPPHARPPHPSPHRL